MLYKIFKLFFDYGHKPPYEEWLKAEYCIDSSIISRNILQKNQFILQAWDLGDFRDTSTLPDFKEGKHRLATLWLMDIKYESILF